MLEEYIQIKIEEVSNIEASDQELTQWKETLGQYPIGSKTYENESESSNYLDALLWRHNFVRPGISDANVVALFYEISISKAAYLEVNQLQDVMFQYFQEDFGAKNVLFGSYDHTQESDIFYFLTYPLPKRRLDPRPWTFKGQMVESKYVGFIHYLEKKFGLKEEVAKTETFVTDDPRALEDMQELEYVTMLGNSSQTTLPYEDVYKIFRETYNYFAKLQHHDFDEARKYNITPEVFLEDVRKYLRRTYNNLTDKDVRFVLDEMYNAVYDYYVLTPLINDPRVGDIKVLKTGKIRVKVDGVRMTSNLKFDSREDYENFVDGIAFRHNIDLSENAMSHFVDTDGNPNFLLRFNISTRYVASNSVSYVHIRKIAKTKPTINELITKNMLNQELALWLMRQAKESTGMIFVGQGGSGKTTLMNVLLEYIPYTKSGMVIQDNEELFTDHHPDIMFLHTVESKGIHYDNPIYDLKAISKNGLLVDIDYFIIGEIKGAEAMYFLNASATGATCWASLHSSYARLDKLADYVMYESKYNRKQALCMLQNLQYVVYMDHYRVREIARVKPWKDELEDLEYETVYDVKTGLIQSEREKLC